MSLKPALRPTECAVRGFFEILGSHKIYILVLHLHLLCILKQYFKYSIRKDDAIFLSKG